MTSVAAESGVERGIRPRVRALVTSRTFETVIIVLIALNAVTLGLETSGSVMSQIGDFLKILDRIILTIFVIELLLRMYAHGAAFWRDPWSLFDLAIVSVALAPATNEFSVMRAFRIIRAFRLISAFPRMRRVVHGLIDAIPSMWTVVVLLLLIFYIFSVMATKLFGAAFGEWFGTIGASAFTLFQIMTLEGWSDGIVRPVMKLYPWAWMFFVPFILITSFAVLNLFIGVIVDAMQSEHEGLHKELMHAERETEAEISEVLEELRGLRHEVGELRQSVSARTGLPPDTSVP